MAVVCLLALRGFAPGLHAQLTESYVFSTNRLIPDGNAAGLSDAQTLASQIGSVTSVVVGLNIVGEFNGDLYAYLRHSSGFVVLLNRVGKTSAVPYGYADSGLDVIFGNDATNGDVHDYENEIIPSAGLPLTGNWAVDGRDIDPALVTDATSRSTSLTNFNGMSAAGEWTLYVADLESGGTNQLAQWSLQISGVSASNVPVLASISDFIIKPESHLWFKLSASYQGSDPLIFTLDPGGPAGATVGPTFRYTNAVFSWTPSRAQASTTNMITVRVSDSSDPSLTTTQSFNVIVLDYLDLGIGSTNVQAGQTVSVPITLSSSDGVTNLTFTIPWPDTQFTNVSIEAALPEIASATIQDQETNLSISIQTVPGQALQGANQIAQLTFLALSNSLSAFVPLRVGSVTALKPGGNDYSNYITHSGTVAVVQTQPLLQATLSPGNGMNLNLYGKLGANYQLQYTTNLDTDAIWLPWLNFMQTNGVVTIQALPAYPDIFFRLLQQ